MDKQVPLMVSIRCFTYNHEPYIRQCLEGFVMQKTNFRFEAIVHDDASTDGTADIIREYAEKYPDIIKPIYETENQYSKRDGSLARIMDAHMHGKYIAICEGDDYWIDPLKLQIQVDFLEANPEYTLIHTGIKIIKEGTTDVIDYVQEINDSDKRKEDLMNDILDNNYRIQTLTTLMPRLVYERVINNDVFLFRLGRFLMGDTQLWCALLNEGNIKYMEDITGVYRRHLGSACNSANLKSKVRFELSCNEMRLYIAKKYNLSLLFRKQRYFVLLLKYLSIDPLFKPIQYNPYPFMYFFAKSILLIPFVKSIIANYTRNHTSVNQLSQ